MNLEKMEVMMLAWSRFLSLQNFTLPFSWDRRKDGRCIVQPEPSSLQDKMVNQLLPHRRGANRGERMAGSPPSTAL